MPHTKDEWRRLMDKKWKELAEQKQFRDRLDIIERTTFPKSLTSSGPKVPAPRKAPPKVPPQRIQKQVQRIKNTETRTPDFDIPAAGARRRELGKKINPTESELREYRDLSNKIEDELDKRQRKINDDMSKA